MSENIHQIILYFYLANIIVAFLSYMPQQKIMLDMICGRRQLSKDISASQYLVWSAANFVTVCYSIFVVKTDLPLIILSSVNFTHSFISALLNFYVRYLFNKQQENRLD